VLVNECKEKGQVAVMVDGITQKNGGKLLRALKSEGVQALVTLHSTMLAGEDMHHIVNKVKRSHELGYHFTGKEKVKVADLKDSEILDELDRAKKSFSILHNVKLQYVFFPYSDDSKLVKRLVALAERAGLTTVSHNIYLTPDSENAMDIIKKNIGNAKAGSHIALMEGTAEGQIPTLKALASHAKKHKFVLTPFSKCVGGKTKPIAEAKKRVNLTKKRTNLTKRKTTHAKAPLTTVKRKVLVNPAHIRGYKISKKTALKNVKPVNLTLKKVQAEQAAAAKARAQMKARVNKHKVLLGKKKPSKKVSSKKSKKTEKKKHPKTGSKNHSKTEKKSHSKTGSKHHSKTEKKSHSKTGSKNHSKSHSKNHSKSHSKTGKDGANQAVGQKAKALKAKNALIEDDPDKLVNPTKSAKLATKSESNEKTGKDDKKPETKDNKKTDDKKVDDKDSKKEGDNAASAQSIKNKNAAFSVTASTATLAVAMIAVLATIF
jgi:hypothetical protein